MVIHRPDFIVIGAMKSATTTLHEQLARQFLQFIAQPVTVAQMARYGFMVPTGDASGTHATHQ